MRHFISLALLCFVTFSFLAVEPSEAADVDTILGAWLTEKGESKITIFKCGKDQDRVCGRITWLKEPNYPAHDKEAGKPKHDRENPDESKKGRPHMGMNNIWGFKYDGEKWSDGKFYYIEEGKTYNCTMELETPNRLKVKGYIGMSLLGKTWKWSR